MDLDATVCGITLTRETARKVFEEICAIEADDDFAYSVVRTSDIRETDDYPGVRVHFKADYAPLSMPLTVDVTTGDRIVPSVERGSEKRLSTNKWSRVDCHTQ